MKKIILASASPRRRELLAGMGADFETVTSDFDERVFIKDSIAVKGYISPEKQTELLAAEKARLVYENINIHGDFVIIGADTSVIIDTDGVQPAILGKPKDKDEAFGMIKLLSGKTHKVVSGIALLDNTGRMYSASETTLVHMREISDREARNYIESEYVLDKAGAYAIQGKAAMFIKGIDGCYFNVVGLPVYKLAQALKNFDIDLLCGGV